MTHKEADLKKRLDNLQEHFDNLSEMIGAMAVKELIVVGANHTEAQEVIVAPSWVRDEIKRFQSIDADLALKQVSSIVG